MLCGEQRAVCAARPGALRAAGADVGCTTFPCWSSMESPVRSNSACSGTAPPRDTACSQLQMQNWLSVRGGGALLRRSGSKREGGGSCGRGGRAGSCQSTCQLDESSCQGSLSRCYTCSARSCQLQSPGDGAFPWRSKALPVLSAQLALVLLSTG